MDFIKKSLVPVPAATVWISVSEFARNELLAKSYWVVRGAGLCRNAG